MEGEERFGTRRSFGNARVGFFLEATRGLMSRNRKIIIVRDRTERESVWQMIGEADRGPLSSFTALAPEFGLNERRQSFAGGETPRAASGGAAVQRFIIGV